MSGSDIAVFQIIGWLIGIPVGIAYIILPFCLISRVGLMLRLLEKIHTDIESLGKLTEAVGQRVHSAANSAAKVAEAFDGAGVAIEKNSGSR